MTQIFYLNILYCQGHTSLTLSVIRFDVTLGIIRFLIWNGRKGCELEYRSESLKDNLAVMPCRLSLR